ncbi:MAG: NADPH-dependent glutamate synthase [Sedimentisphaerales bacterium]|nr:NADPH-dependent glutamate synthase [Sedimentisphaerales bacterium]
MQDRLELMEKGLDQPSNPDQALDALLEKARTGRLSAAERLKIPPQPMPQLDPVARRRSMQEVAVGYTEQQAKWEALRCLQCKRPSCVEGCPVRIQIPQFISCIVEGRYDRALAIIKQTSLLPAVCGRVCPQEVQCQQACVLCKRFGDPFKAVSIGRLERFVADQARSSDEIPKVDRPTGKKVAIVGSGPGGIVAAADTRRAGHEVTIFEAFHMPGGVLVYGIPEFRLPKAIVQQEIDVLVRMGVKIIPNFVVGKTRTIQQLLQEDGFDAVYIGVGAGLPRFMGIEGESLVGVYSANEYLTRANLMKAYMFGDCADTPIAKARNVAVIGGGNVAMDAARMAIRLGAERVYLVYRRTEAEMPARREEVHHAREEGVEFLFLQSPQRIIGDDLYHVRAIECIHYQLGQPDRSGRPRPIPILDARSVLEVDMVIVAIGNVAHPLIRQTTAGLQFNETGNIIVDEHCRTSMARVYAGGDIVLGAATVILAMGQGRIAAASINEDLA